MNLCKAEIEETRHEDEGRGATVTLPKTSKSEIKSHCTIVYKSEKVDYFLAPCLRIDYFLT
jgi:hypothetical protein